MAILAHVCSFGLRPAFPPLFLGVAIVAILYLGGGLKPAAFLLFGAVSLQFPGFLRLF